jgi:cytochrome c oxidase subunit II
MPKHPLVRMFAIGGFASAIGIALVLWMDWFPSQGAEEAKDIDRLYDILLMFSIPIFVLVMTVAIYSVVAFRARPGDKRDGAPIHGNTRLEAIWVTIPFLIVAGLAAYAWIVLDDIEDRPAKELEVRVTGQQFAWSFEYPPPKGPDGKPMGKAVKTTRLLLPKDRDVRFRIRSLDVIHSFWVPDFRLKMDAVPGQTTTWRAKPIELGNHDIVCAELCGLGHSTMRQTARVVPGADFDKWLRERQGGGAAAAARPGSPQQAAEGKRLFTDSGCNACHALADAGSTARVGPSLDELAADARRFGRGKSPEDYVRESIEAPDAFVVPGFPRGTMPSDYKQQLTPQEIDALVRYLLGAGGGKGS